MNRNWQAFRAELSKQHRNSFTGRSVFFSLLLWPALTFCSAFYSMKPFRDGLGSALQRVLPDGSIALFLISGFFVFQLYWTVVQAAWTFEWERKGGTLEVVFLAPGSKLAFLLGRSVYALGNGMWMFFVFSLLTFLFVASFQRVAWGHLAVALLVTLFSAVVWGSLLCAVSLFSRDSGYLYYIFQAPMNLFGGVRVPTAVFPIWAKAFSLFFPVTYSLYLVREALSGQISANWWLWAGGLLAISVLLIFVTFWVLKRAESFARRHGNWTMF